MVELYRVVQVSHQFVGQNVEISYFSSSGSIVPKSMGVPLRGNSHCVVVATTPRGTPPAQRARSTNEIHPTLTGAAPRRSRRRHTRKTQRDAGPHTRQPPALQLKRSV